MTFSHCNGNAVFVCKETPIGLNISFCYLSFETKLLSENPAFWLGILFLFFFIIIIFNLFIFVRAFMNGLSLVGFLHFAWL
jgi:hypothetical protein